MPHNAGEPPPPPPQARRTASCKDTSMNSSRAESWLRRALRCAPQPLPPGRFPRILEEGEQAGFSHGQLLDALDEWLAWGYCRLTDQVSHDIQITETGRLYFGGVPKDDTGS